MKIKNTEYLNRTNGMHRGFMTRAVVMALVLFMTAGLAWSTLDESVFADESENAAAKTSSVEKQLLQKKIHYRTVRVRSSKYRKTTRRVKAGREGIRTLVYLVTRVDGEPISRKLVASRVSRKAVDRKIIYGTGTFNAPKRSRLSGTSGGDVAEFALRFVGNPYRYGGSSLTRGADCSGFVMAVYSRFGVRMGHSASTQRAYGVPVSLKNAKAGDIICFPGHVGIYLGNRKIVHAMDPAHGITISRLGYNGKPILTIRRIFK